MSRLEQLYQETILAHNRSPRNFGKLEPCTHNAIGRNPLCGDSYQLFARIEGEQICEIRFFGEGCAISKASASIMSELVKGKNLGEARQYNEAFLQLLLKSDLKSDLEERKTEYSTKPEDRLPRKLQIFAGVREYPMRVKCATLIWRALEAILNAHKEADGEANAETNAEFAGGSEAPKQQRGQGAAAPLEVSSE